jgi:hypothetical protein
MLIAARRRGQGRAVALGLKSAAAAARLILSHAGRPPGGGTNRQRSAPPQAIITGRPASPGTLAAKRPLRGGHRLIPTS